MGFLYQETDAAVAQLVWPSAGADGCDSGALLAKQRDVGIDNKHEAYLVYTYDTTY